VKPKLYRIVVKEHEAPSVQHPDGRWVHLGYHPIHKTVSHTYPKRIAELVARRLANREPNHEFILEATR
jgi:hypothetical protein